MHLLTSTREIVQSVEGEIETDYIDSNFLDDSDDILNRDNEVGGDVPDVPVWNYLDEWEYREIVIYLLLRLLFTYM